jgi:hypothetical protein
MIISLIIACFVKRSWYIRGWLITALIMSVISAIAASPRVGLAYALGYCLVATLFQTALAFGLVGFIRWLFIWRHDDDDKKAGLTR